MSASSRETSRSITGGASSQAAGGRHHGRLSWSLAVPLIVLMSLICWTAIWKGGAALLTLLH